MPIPAPRNDVPRQRQRGMLAHGNAKAGEKVAETKGDKSMCTKKYLIAAVFALDFPALL